MWGVKVNHDRSRIVCAFEKIFTIHHFHQYNYDQYLLKKFIWPMAKTNMVIMRPAVKIEY
jgi:predicted glycosyltransferase